jgi:hypothetical protein
MTWPFIDRLDAAWPGESRQGSAVGLSARTALDAVIDGDQPRHISKPVAQQHERRQHGGRLIDVSSPPPPPVSVTASEYSYPLASMTS